MRIILIQDEIYLPSFGGGTKANRCLLESLGKRGHECLALTRALTRSSDGPNDAAQFSETMRARGVELHAMEPGVYTYEHRGVRVEALDQVSVDERRDYLTRRIEAMQPDWAIVTDDKRRFMLDAALQAAPGRVMLLLQTIVQLPFGPLSVQPNPAYAERFREVQAILVISRFMQQYIHEHSGLEAQLVRIPVYGDGPFPELARFDAGYVTMINPCQLKGIDIFLQLASQYPDVPFAAVPTWGTDAEALARLRALPNVRLLQPVDDIDVILAQTRILLVPSLWPETFGYVVPEAMLRGIPVLASQIGGLPEAKLGVQYLIAVNPGEFRDGRFVCPPQNVTPWAHALDELLFDEQAYARCSRLSREAALAFVGQISVTAFERLMTDAERPSIHPEFKEHIERQPYTIVLDGLTLTVDRDVFPPDLGRCAQNMARIAQGYRAQTALDMGCGSGYLALALKRSGVADVWAADIHQPAVTCANANAHRNAAIGPIHVVQSDLFENLPCTVKFDLIVFNQPFGPGRGETICGCGPDGGYAITKRFLSQAAERLSPDGVILMAFSDREPPEHSPQRVAEEFGYPVTTLLHAYYNDANNYIFEIRPNRGR
jgi:glycosyltransferase involved in cell wall biosynthesis/SAM-dependent methyltransferase